MKEKTLQTYKYLLEAPNQATQNDLSQAVKCVQCGRMFASMNFLKKHYERRHPNANFERDYPSEKD